MENDKLSQKIDEIRKQADIVDIISRYINVISKGKSYKAICPFHNDTNPSLSISKDKQIFKCFVCNNGGNVFTFVQKYQKIPFMRAVKEVADIVGIDFELKEEKQIEVLDNKSKILYNILNDTMLFYKNSLLSNKEALEYCKNRNLTSNIINDFKIGYSPNATNLIEFLLAKDYSKEDIFDSGVALDHEGELVDRFANRLIFPITDLDGKIVAFSGRIIEKIDAAKYVNSPETKLFIKGNTFYNYANALSYIKQEKKMYICEGFMDCIAFNKAGIKNVVALMGTAFTKEHLRILKFLGVEIILALDGDDPGNINALKLANELLDLNIITKVIPNYEDVKDVDEYLDKYGKDKLLEHLNNSIMPAFDFNFYVASKLDELENNENKKKFLKKMCSRISKMSEQDIDLYSNMLHEKLGFSKSTINAEIEKAKKVDSISVKENINQYKKFSKSVDMQIRLLTQMMDSKEAIEIYTENMALMDDEAFKKIAYIISDYYADNKDNLNMDYLVADVISKVQTDYPNDETLTNALLMIDERKDKYPKYSKQSFEDLLFELNEIEPLEREIKIIKDDLPYNNDSQQQKDMITRLTTLKMLIKEKKATHALERKQTYDK